jgi:hypothetical protein
LQSEVILGYYFPDSFSTELKCRRYRASSKFPSIAEIKILKTNRPMLDPRASAKATMTHGASFLFVAHRASYFQAESVRIR